MFIDMVRADLEQSQIKKMLLSTALTVLLVSAASAQSSNSPSPTASSPGVNTPAQPNSGKANFVTSQKPNQWLASAFKGTNVLGTDGQKIGDISDILFDKDGKIEAYVVSVGGILGMGATQVALTPDSFNVVPGENGKADVLKLSLNKDELKQAQNFMPYEPPRPTTTGSAPSGLGPLPGGMRPSTNTPPSGQ